jgi:hypothetical protein
MMQTASSGSTSSQKASTVGTKVVSASTISGPVSRSGSFTATGSALFIDAVVGYIRASYRISGQFSGSSWSGQYETTALFEDAGGSCRYLSNFSGSKM